MNGSRRMQKINIGGFTGVLSKPGLVEMNKDRRGLQRFVASLDGLFVYVDGAILLIFIVGWMSGM